MCCNITNNNIADKINEKLIATYIQENDFSFKCKRMYYLFNENVFTIFTLVSTLFNKSIVFKFFLERNFIQKQN